MWRYCKRVASFKSGDMRKENKMILSRILRDMSMGDACEIFHEREFETLGLAVSDVHRPFCTFADDEKWLRKLGEEAVMVITRKDLQGKMEEYFGKTKGICITDYPREMFFRVHNFLKSSWEYVRETVPSRTGTGCDISPLASIDRENVQIGDNVVVEEFAVIRANTSIGNGTVIRAGAKIGGQGFEYKRLDGSIMGVCHLGGVRIGENVEIQYNTCVDRAVYPWDDTMIGDFSKIDNLVHIGHAAKIGRNVLIVAQSGIGGRTEIADHSWVGFGATVSNGLHIQERARINIGSVVTRDVGIGEAVSGNFAIEHQRFLQNLKNVCSGGGV